MKVCPITGQNADGWYAARALEDPAVPTPTGIAWCPAMKYTIGELVRLAPPLCPNTGAVRCASPRPRVRHEEA